MRQWFSQTVSLSFYSFCLPLLVVYRGLTALRRLAYECGLFQVSRLPVPVVVVGNVIVGGAGKTPLTYWLVEQLRNQAYRPGVISRGYGRQTGDAVLQVLPGSDPAAVGDEPLMLAQQLGCPVWVGGRRAEAGRALLAAHPEVNVLVCDDGLQHLALGRDIELLVFDGRGWGNGHCLPVGPLREPSAPIRHVDAVIFNGPPVPQVFAATGRLPTYQMALEPQAFYRLGQPEDQCLARDLQTQGKPLYALAGIGHPERFFQTLRDMGLAVTSQAFPDHHVFTCEDLGFAAGGLLLMTEKDAVKCAHLSVSAVDVWVLPVRAALFPMPNAAGDESPALLDYLLEKLMDPRLLDILVCPICKGKLTYQKSAQELECAPCKLAYPIRDGIPVMLENEARPLATSAQ